MVQKRCLGGQQAPRLTPIQLGKLIKLSAKNSETCYSYSLSMGNK